MKTSHPSLATSMAVALAACAVCACSPQADSIRSMRLPVTQERPAGIHGKWECSDTKAKNPRLTVLSFSPDGTASAILVGNPLSQFPPERSDVTASGNWRISGRDIWLSLSGFSSAAPEAPRKAPPSTLRLDLSGRAESSQANLFWDTVNKSSASPGRTTESSWVCKKLP